LIGYRRKHVFTSVGKKGISEGTKDNKLWYENFEKIWLCINYLIAKYSPSVEEIIISMNCQ